MGNCLRHDSKVQWGGEDWSPAITSGDQKPAMNAGDDDEEVVNSKKGEHSKIKEVKVKITKKQLEELLGKMDVQQGLSTEQILGQLVKVSVHYETHLIRSWKPRLQSIPEN